MKNKGYKDAICTAIAVLVILLFIVFSRYTSAIPGPAMYLLGLFIGTVFLWMSVGVSWSSLFCIAGLCFIPGVSVSTIITSSIGNTSVSFLIYTFICSYALEQTQFVRRCAIKLLSFRFVRKDPWYFMLVYFAAILILGSFMSTTVLVVVFLTLNEEIFMLLGLQKGDKVANMLTMGLVIVASISGGITPIAHLFPLMAISLYEKATGLAVSYIKFMCAAIPAGIMATLFALLMFKLVLKPDTSCMKNLDLRHLQKTLSPPDKKEKITVGVFAGVVALWILPELISGFLPNVASFISSKTNLMPPLIGTIILCIWPVDGKPILHLPTALTKITWTAVFMASAALALGGQLANADIGLTTILVNKITPVLEHMPGLLFIVAMVFFTGFMTNVASNMVAVTLACTLAIPICALMPNVSTVALCSVIGMTASYAFATPPATTTVTIAISTGWTDTASMAKYGFTILAFSCAVLSLIAYPIAAALM